MNIIKTKRGHVKGSLTRAASFAKSIDDRVSLELLELRLENLEETWAEFVALNNQLFEHSGDAEFVNPDEEFPDYEEKYFVAYSTIKKVIRERKIKSNPSINESVVEKIASQQASFLKALSAPEQSASISLPTFKIPVFSGNYQEWPSFRDLFLGTVDEKKNLTPTQKFHFLKSFVSGDAANLIRHITVSDSNYLDAWERLEKRYDRSSYIIQSYIKSFVSMPSMSSNAVSSLRKITDSADETIRGLNALESTSRDPWVIYLLLQKLDYDTRHAWAENVGAKDDSTIDDLLSFLSSRCDALEACQTQPRLTQPRGKPPKPIQSHFAESNLSCPHCKLEHSLSKCPKFLSCDISTRRSFVKEHSLCYNCLRSGHSSNRCRSNFRCRICKSRHHSLVHLDQSSSTIPADTDTTSFDVPATSSNLRTGANTCDIATLSSTNPPITLCSSVEPIRGSPNKVRYNHTLLPTAIAWAHDKQGTLQNVRLLLDSGSQVSFVTEQTVQRLGLSRKKARIPILGVGSTAAGVTNGFVTLKLTSRFNQGFVEVQCYIVSKLTSLIPASVATVPNSETFATLQLADPYFNKPGHIDVLIGAEKVFSVFNSPAVQGENGMPDLIPTIFGLVVCGNMDTLVSSNRDGIDSFCTQLDSKHSFDLERFWRLEEVNYEPGLSMEDKRAEDIFVNTHSRLPDGRYMVELPFKSDKETDFKNSFNVALNRFQSTERRIALNPYLREKYTAFMNEYLNLGHMELVPDNEMYMCTRKCYYLPHHAVLKDDSSTTKVRVVFDGSAKSASTQSLNETLLVGHINQRDLFSICIRFRRHVYTISGDIEKMFRQIRVSEKHTNFQRILWRESSDQPLKHYRLLTVTYGTTPAPFLAVRTLTQLARDSIEAFPRAAQVLLNDFYIDDVMTGSDSIEEVTSLRLELINLLKSGGFNLRKWTTNCWPLLLSLPEDQRELSPRDFENYGSVKLLGLQWSPAKDAFSYKVHLSEDFSFTKRNILSESSKIFDPIGFLTPVIIGVKILFQELWRKKYHWDDLISPELSNRWLSIRKDLPHLEKLNIERLLWKTKNNVEFHGFCDASLDAYAAVVYCRSVDSTGNVTCTIVAAKSRVAPIKVVSLPRLELCGAVLLTRLINKLKVSLQYKEMQVFAWTDSAIVLHWLSALPKKWSVFIANRTSEILETIPRQQWYHVRSHHNPADCASRGIAPSHLINNELWWTGPSWIKDQRDQWPESSYSLDDISAETLEERVRKSKPLQVLVTQTDNDNFFERIINYSSSYLNAIRSFAFSLRFISNSRVKKGLRNDQPLSVEEIETAKLRLIKYHQSINFKRELNIIAKGEFLRSGDKLASLAPFIDRQGVLRVGGRIQESNEPFSTKHPILIDKSTRFAKLIVEQIHKRYLHAGVSQMFAILRREYFIVGCRNLLRKVLHECVNCFRHRQTTAKQIMANLPSDRVRFSRPFSKVGVDYAGPITLRLARGRNPKFVKGYIALFVCFTTKAIHLELVGDLSSNAFLAALDRFASRRGKPAEIWSDNATNFHGAKRNLDEMFQILLSQKHHNIVVDHLSKDSINWKFIPPSAPHFGGLWEAGVKSVKYHLKRVIKDHRLTFEEMYTLLTQVEALLNSRPMWPTSDMDPIALSPAHFLIGETLTSIPRPMCDKPVCPFNNWSLLQTLKQGFWKRWHAEYLTSLQQRPKWRNTEVNLAVNDVVMLKEPNLPPSKWILGRVTKVHPGKDQRNRVATIITQTGEYVRPIVKLAPLPFSERR